MGAVSLLAATFVSVGMCPAVAVGQSVTTGTTPETSAAPTAASGQSTETTTTPERSASSSRPAGPCLPARSAGTAAATEATIDPPVTFQASPLTATRNFGADRDAEDVVFKLTTEKQLEKNIEKRLELVADPIVRVGEATESASFPEPTFSALRVSRNRKTISFRVCLNPDKDLAAGKYVGTINLEGPDGIESSTMTVTANAKNGPVFVVSLILALILAFVTLLHKGANAARARDKAEAETMPNKQDGTPTPKKKKALEKADSYWSAAWASFRDFNWLFPTLFALGGAFGALWGIYVANPAWGEAGALTSGIAVIGAALAAIGARTIFTDAK